MLLTGVFAYAKPVYLFGYSSLGKFNLVNEGDKYFGKLTIRRRNSVSLRGRSCAYNIYLVLKLLYYGIEYSKIGALPPGFSPAIVRVPARSSENPAYFLLQIVGANAAFAGRLPGIMKRTWEQ
jgi:hypothetical protein